MMYNENEPDHLDRGKGCSPAAGRFITFEGIDGSGKTTHFKRLAAALRDEGFEVLELREPGGTAIGEDIRKIVLDKENVRMCIETELLLFEAARAQLTREVIIPALKAGKWVICDRYFDSSLVYQGFGRGLELDMISILNHFAVDGCMPDATILIDVPVEAAEKRVLNRSSEADRLDVEGVAFKQRTREGYLKLAADSNGRIIVFDAELPKAIVAQQIFQTIKEGFIL
jgi:dTMP kinase